MLGEPLEGSAFEWEGQCRGASQRTLARHHQGSHGESAEGGSVGASVAQHSRPQPANRRRRHADPVPLRSGGHHAGGPTGYVVIVRAALIPR
jgi:hypothetical protein